MLLSVKVDADETRAKSTLLMSLDTETILCLPHVLIPTISLLYSDTESADRHFSVDHGPELQARSYDVARVDLKCTHFGAALMIVG